MNEELRVRELRLGCFISNLAGRTRRRPAAKHKRNATPFRIYFFPFSSSFFFVSFRLVFYYLSLFTGGLLLSSALVCCSFQSFTVAYGMERNSARLGTRYIPTRF